MWQKYLILLFVRPQIKSLILMQYIMDGALFNFLNFQIKINFGGKISK